MGIFLCRVNPLTPPSYKTQQDNLYACYEGRKGISAFLFKQTLLLGNESWYCLQWVSQMPLFSINIYHFTWVVHLG